MDFLKRKPKDLDADEQIALDAVDETGSIVDNDKAQKRQRMLFFGIGGIAVIGATMFVLDTGETVDEVMEAGPKTQVSTDALMNRQMVDQEWMSMYEGQINSQDQRLKGVEKQSEQVAQLQNEIQSLRGQNAEMARDGQHVLDAYERENQQLRLQIERGNAHPTAPGPVAAARDMEIRQTAGSGTAATAPPARRGSDVQMVAFTQGAGTGSRIDPAKAPAVYTDSPNYLPPNSMANAVVVVGVDATTNTRSQSDPLPVLLRITGPARSVYGEGRLLATRVQGCMVNGAAYGDLSSEKVYVKLQRMTCAQPGGRFAVSEVKGFIAFGGKVGIRGRVVSREGGLTTQAFIAGLFGGVGNAFQGANQIPRIAQEPVLPSASDVGIQAIGGGAATAGNTLSDYLIERAEQYQPVVEMPTGAAVEVVFLDGTFIRN